MEHNATTTVRAPFKETHQTSHKGPPVPLGGANAFQSDVGKAQCLRRSLDPLLMFTAIVRQLTRMLGYSVGLNESVDSTQEPAAYVSRRAN